MSDYSDRRLQFDLTCKKSLQANDAYIDSSTAVSAERIRVDQEIDINRIVKVNVIEIMRFKEGGITNLQDYINRLESVANAVLERRRVNKALKGKATMHDGLQAMRAAETKMQDAVDRLLE